jgi:hypothetical protein
MMKVLKDVIVSCNDLTTRVVSSIPKRCNSAVEIAKDIMKNGCWTQPKEDIAIFIAPTNIASIEFVRADVPDDKLEEEGYGPPGEE